MIIMFAAFFLQVCASPLVISRSCQFTLKISFRRGTCRILSLALILSHHSHPKAMFAVWDEKIPKSGCI
jgi:hypothetical protein